MIKKNKRNVFNTAKNIYEGRELVINAFKRGLFPLKSTTGTGPLALAQVKAGNNSESLLNEIRQIVHSLYQSKQITTKVYNNIIKSVQL